jgi:hypothetical protein
LPLYEEKLKELEATLKKEAKYNDPAVQADIARRIQESLDKSRVLCLCETQTNPRLWAHYSDGHRGFCLEFDSTLKPFSHALRVRYTKDYPKLDINAPANKFFRTFLLTKSELWKDEEEWRCVDFPGGSAQWPIPKKALKAVIFGTRASADLRATIAQLITAHKPWVELREVVEIPFSYDLQVRPPGEHALLRPRQAGRFEPSSPLCGVTFPNRGKVITHGRPSEPSSRRSLTEFRLSSGPSTRPKGRLRPFG